MARKKASVDRPTKPAPAPVLTRQQADPDLWFDALKLAGGDHRRLRVISRTRIDIIDDRYDTKM